MTHEQAVKVLAEYVANSLEYEYSRREYATKVMEAMCVVTGKAWAMEPAGEMINEAYEDGEPRYWVLPL